MLTVNANEHPLMKRFHKSGDEKRSVVIVRLDAHGDWLSCRGTDEARSFLNLFLPRGWRRVPHRRHPGKLLQRGFRLCLGAVLMLVSTKFAQELRVQRLGQL